MRFKKSRPETLVRWVWSELEARHPKGYLLGELAADLAADERQSLLERVRVARLLVGGVDALQRFSVWQGPERL